MKRRVIRLGAIALGAVLLSSCTFVPSDSAPQVLNKHSVPFGLLNTKPVNPGGGG